MYGIRTRRSALAAAALAALAALVAGSLLVLPAAAKGPAGNRLDAKVVATNPGPLTACQDLSTCTPDANIVRYYIYVENGNELSNSGVFATRATVPNAFVVNSIDQAVFIDGVQYQPYDFTWTPPPSPSFRPYSGHWPVAVTCPAEGPCNQVASPAVLPGEQTAAFYTGWAHGDEEPNGTHVFRFTIHGTLNGTPVDLVASSPPILMTD